MNPLHIIGGLAVVAGAIGGPIAALDYLDTRHAPAGLEKVLLEDRVLDWRARCDTGEPRACQRYEQVLMELCRRFPDSYLCR